jgi:uncharacterized membrane protein YphA (DoxX/SURF4 family)
MAGAHFLSDVLFASAIVFVLFFIGSIFVFHPFNSKISDSTLSEKNFLILSIIVILLLIALFLGMWFEFS